MGLLDDIKNDVKKSGSNKGKIMYFRPGVKNRVRFLQELEGGLKILFHDSFELGVNHPCQEIYGRDCPNHEDEGLRHRDSYAWAVWDHEAKEVRILMGPANNFSPVPQIVGFYDTYGTIMDRDYVITKNGQGTNQSWAVIPMDKSKFKNEKAKTFSEKKMLEIIDKAFPSEEGEEGEKKKGRSKGASKKGKKKGVRERLEEIDEKEKLLEIAKLVGISGKSLKELKKAEEEDIIEAILEYDEEEIVESLAKLEEDDEEDGEEEDDEEEEEIEYKKMSPPELYKLCLKKGLKAKPKKEKKYYIELLEEDKEEDDEEEEW